MKTNKVKNLIGQTVYIIDIENIERENRIVFLDGTNRIGEIKMSENHEFYPSLIYFSDIDNAYLCENNIKITYYTKKQNPEYFL